MSRFAIFETVAVSVHNNDEDNNNMNSNNSNNEYPLYEFEVPLSQELNEESNLSLLSVNTTSDINCKSVPHLKDYDESKMTGNTFSLRDLESGTSRTNDDIHTTIHLCPVSKAVIDTPQVQRLRKLRQLGTTEYVYMNAGHNRFEHSLGVMHLAEKMCRQIQRRQPQLGVTEKDVLCVKLAGLCHDLGHGPFSHMFEDVFQNDMKHEGTSLMMIDALLKYLGLEISGEKEHLDSPLVQIGDGVRAAGFGVITLGNNIRSESLPLEEVLTSRDWIFIKECIIAHPLEGEIDYIGRPETKEFLYDIVCNRHNGLDVDKIDYFARDKRKAFGSGSEINVIFVDEAVVAWSQCNDTKCFRCCRQDKQPSACISASSPDLKFKKKSFLAKYQKPQRIKRYNEHLMICYPDKLLVPSIQFFQTRFNLHSNVYTHKATCAVEFMVRDILRMADPHVNISYLDSDSSQVSFTNISKAIYNPNSFLRLDDSIIDRIYDESLTNSNLKDCKILIDRLKARQLYKLAHVKELKNTIPKHQEFWERFSAEEIENGIINLEHAKRDTGNNSILILSKSDFFVQKLELHHGRKDQNPVSLMGFIPKDQMHKLPEFIEATNPKDDSLYESHLPRVFQKRCIRVYAKDATKRGLIEQAAQQWWTNQGDDAVNDSQLEITEEYYSSPPTMLSQEEEDDGDMSRANKRTRY